MSVSEDASHNLLFIIVTVLFFLFATGTAVPGEVPAKPVIVA
ncbi:MAG: hypothetical protein N3I35_19465 [Clostridia bacterium]|nr:hypothetical protein [Clostridia bacterium]